MVFIHEPKVFWVMLNFNKCFVLFVPQERYSEAESLAFWMANASELLHFLKSDRHISAFSLDAQDILAETVQMAFRNLVECLQAELAGVMPVFLSISDREEGGDDEPATAVSVQKAPCTIGNLLSVTQVKLSKLQAQMTRLERALEPISLGIAT